MLKMGTVCGAGSGVIVSLGGETPSSKLKVKQRTPKTTPKKKSSSQKALMGHKWFKGSPKSRSNQRISKKLLKSPIIEKTVQKPPTPVGFVEFDFEGSFDRISVYDLVPCIAMDQDTLGRTAGDAYNSDVNSLSAHGDKNSKLGKDASKSRGGSSKSKSKTPNRLSNKNKATKDLESRRKSPPICKLPEACYDKVANHNISVAPPLPVGYIRYMEIPQEELADEVEYDLDEEDNAWLQFVNDKRKEQSLHPVKYADMELLMDRLEKESYFQMQSTGIDQGALIDDDAVCCICMDGECQNSNAILFCDMCNLAVHQECYGVPYIPEGQWLCRRCLQSPSRAVDCALCPNKGGAFKQTDDGRWAHVVCAIWIPEVCFANTVFLEPIDSIGNIPAARWRLVCFICKQKGVGACIQCHKSNCYIAFHVTCAQQAGLCMKMDTVRESSSVSVKKTAYCDNHAPPESDFLKEGDGTPSPRQKMRQARKLLAEKRSAIPVLSLPTIPTERVAEISQTVSFARKNQFIKRLMAYWKLKRQSRNGVPLLRRLQASSSLPHPSNRDTSAITDPNKAEESQAYYRYWLRLRQDLERARLLCELVRKREKVKKELIHLKCREVEIQLRPFSIFLLNVLEEIAVKDILDIFAEPVDTAEVPDYFEVVEKPMDLSTIRDKINSFQYNNIDEFDADFNLMIDNCLNYNSKDTVFYRSAVRLRELGGIIIRHARRSIDAIGYDPDTGLHLPERKYVPVVLTDEQIIQKVDNLLNDESRFDKPFDKHMELLNDALDDTLALSHAATRKKKFSKVKHEQIRVRRLKHSKLNKLSSTSPLKEKYKKTSPKENLNSADNSKDLSDLSQVQNQYQIRSTRRSHFRSKSRISFHSATSTPSAVQDSLNSAASPPTITKRILRPGKRKREPSPLHPRSRPIPPPQERSSSHPPSPSTPPFSPPVLRGSTSKLKAVASDVISSSAVRSPPKKPRRISNTTFVESLSVNSATGTGTTPSIFATPVKNLSKLTNSSSTNSRNTNGSSCTPGSSDWKRSLSFPISNSNSSTPSSSSTITPSASTNRLAACLRDRDRDRSDDRIGTGIGIRLRDRDSLSSDKISPLRTAPATALSKSPSSIVGEGGVAEIGVASNISSPSSTTNRRDAILFSKKVNTALVFNSESHNSNSSPLKNQNQRQLSSPCRNSNSKAKSLSGSPHSQSPSVSHPRMAKTTNANVKKSTPSCKKSQWMNNNNTSNPILKNKSLPTPAEIEVHSSCSRSVPRRNSTRTRNKKASSNLVNNNTAMTNNNHNVMNLNNSSSLSSWRNNNFYSSADSDQNHEGRAGIPEDLGMNHASHRSSTAVSVTSSLVSSWNHNSHLASSVSVTKVNHSHIVRSDDTDIHSNNNNRNVNTSISRSRKKKCVAADVPDISSISASSPHLSTNSVGKNQRSGSALYISAVEATSGPDHYNHNHNNHSYTSTGSGLIGRVPAISNSHSHSNNNNNSRSVKADSFLVYRSGRDMDSNSEEDDRGNDKEEKVDAISDSDGDDDKDSSASASVSASDEENGSHDSVSAISVSATASTGYRDFDDSNDDNSGSSSSSESSDSSDGSSSSSSSGSNSVSVSKLKSATNRTNKIANRINSKARDSSSQPTITATTASSSDSASSASTEESDSSDSECSAVRGADASSLSQNLIMMNHKNTRGLRQRQSQQQDQDEDPSQRQRVQRPFTRQVVNNVANHKQEKGRRVQQKSKTKINNKFGESENEKSGVEGQYEGHLSDKIKRRKEEYMDSSDNDDDGDDDGNDNDDDVEEGLVVGNSSPGNMLKVRLQPLDLVWARCKEGSWNPALIINPDMPLGFTQNDVPIPGPPQEILLKRPRNSHEHNFLVLCFDNKRTWEWISRNHLEPLGQDPKTDKGHLMTRKSDKRSLGALRKAYEKALLHRNRVSGADGRLSLGFPN